MKLRVAGRILVFGLIAAYMVGGPFYRQVLGGKNNLFRNWVMFAGANLDVCEVRYHLADSKEPIDRYAVLGYEPWYTAKSSNRKLSSVDDVWRQGRQLCTKLGPDTDLRAEAKCAQRSGWKRVMSGDVNLCHARVDRSKGEASRPGDPD